MYVPKQKNYTACILSFIKKKKVLIENSKSIQEVLSYGINIYKKRALH